MKMYVCMNVFEGKFYGTPQKKGVQYPPVGNLLYQVTFSHI